MAKFLHIADVHIDREFQVPKEATPFVKQLNERIMVKIIDVAIEKDVDVVLFAGDTFHQAKSSVHTQSFLASQLERLKERGIVVVMTFGNHDYYEENKYWVDWNAYGFVFTSEEVDTIEFTTKNGEVINISAFSYTQPHIEENKVQEFPLRNPNATLHLGIYHGMVGKMNSYAPFSLEEMKAKNLDYWALGHIHLPQILSNQPLIVYPGTPIGHHINEDGDGGVILGELKDGVVFIEKINVAELIFRSLEVDLTEVESLQDAMETIRQELEVNTVVQLTIKNAAHIGEEWTRSAETGELLEYLKEVAWIRKLTILEDTPEKTIQLQMAEDEFSEILSETDLKAAGNSLLTQLPIDVKAEMDEAFYEDLFTTLKIDVTNKIAFESEDRV